MSEKKNQTLDQTAPTVSIDPALDAKKAKKAIYEAKYKAIHDEARVRIKAFLKDNAEQLGGLKADIELFLGKGGVRKASSGGFRSVNSELRDAFIEKKSLTEMDIFKAFRIGRPEMVGKIRILTLTPNHADRVWVKFDEATETYNVMGLGTNPPAGWTGYIPASRVQGL